MTEPRRQETPPDEPGLKIISGGQNGADIAGWKAAKACGLETGGWMPRGFRTLDGPRPEYAHLYGAVEHDSDAYPPRTLANVTDSDATLILAHDFKSNGTRLTLNCVNWHRKPSLPVDLTKSLDGECVRRVAQWLDIGGFRVLNVAGNSERKGRPAVEAASYPLLVAVFTALCGPFPVPSSPDREPC